MRSSVGADNTVQVADCVQCVDLGAVQCIVVTKGSASSSLLELGGFCARETELIPLNNPMLCRHGA